MIATAFLLMDSKENGVITDRSLISQNYLRVTTVNGWIEKVHYINIKRTCMHVYSLTMPSNPSL